MGMTLVVVASFSVNINEWEKKKTKKKEKKKETFWLWWGVEKKLNDTIKPSGRNESCGRNKMVTYKSSRILYLKDKRDEIAALWPWSELSPIKCYFTSNYTIVPSSFLYTFATISEFLLLFNWTLVAMKITRDLVSATMSFSNIF